MHYTCYEIYTYYSYYASNGARIDSEPVDHKRQSKKESGKMETFQFFWLRQSLSYDSAYNSEFWFSLGCKNSYDSDSNSIASENSL